MKTELVLNKKLSSTTKEKNVFEVLDNFFKQNKLNWKKGTGCTTDEASSMLGHKSGFTTYVKAVSSNTTIVHCFKNLHRFAICAKVLSEIYNLLFSIYSFFVFFHFYFFLYWVELFNDKK